MIVHVELAVTDLDRAVAFYSRLLQVELERTEIDGYPMAMFPVDESQPGASVALVMGDAYVPTRDGAIVYFAVDTLAAALDRARELGAEVLYGPVTHPQAGDLAEIADSEGNRIALLAPSA
jgi:predicted enzyme related to lactoylglutathione lyase